MQMWQEAIQQMLLTVGKMITEAKQFLETGFLQLGDLLRDATISTASAQSYDTSTGTTTATVTTKTIKAHLANYGRKEIDGKHILVTDRKCIFLTKSITAISTLDTVTVDSVVYRVIDWRKDVTQTLFTLQLRA